MPLYIIVRLRALITHIFPFPFGFGFYESGTLTKFLDRNAHIPISELPWHFLVFGEKDIKRSIMGAAGSSLPSVSDGIGLSGTKALHRAWHRCTGRFNPRCASPCVIFICAGGSVVSVPDQHRAANRSMSETFCPKAKCSCPLKGQRLLRWAELPPSALSRLGWPSFRRSR